MAIEIIEFKFVSNYSGLHDALFMRCSVESQKVDFIFRAEVIDDYILETKGNLGVLKWQEEVKKKITKLTNLDEEFRSVLLTKLIETLKDPLLIKQDERVKVKLEEPNIFKNYRDASDFSAEG